MNALAPKMPEYQDNIQAKLHAVNDYFIAALSKVTRSAEDIRKNLPQSAKGQGATGDSRAAVLGSRTFPDGEPPASPGWNVRHADRRFGVGRHRLRSRGFLSAAARGLARSLHSPGGKRSSDRDHADAGRRRQAGQPIPLDAISRQCHFWRCGRHRALPDRRAQCHSVGDTGRNIEVRSLHRHVDCRRGADRSGDGHLDGLAGAHPHVWAVCGLGTLLRECPGAMALWQGHRRVGQWRSLVAAVFWTWLWGVPGLLLATPLTVCLLGDRQARSPTGLLAHSAGE